MNVTIATALRQAILANLPNPDDWYIHTTAYRDANGDLQLEAGVQPKATAIHVTDTTGFSDNPYHGVERIARSIKDLMVERIRQNG